MRLIVQPGDGVLPLVKAINSAKNSVQIVIFRFDQREIERALANAVTRGVAVHALIAHTNRAGEDSLRRLEMRLLAAGVMVARTADDLARYHGKLLIIDRRELLLLAFNLTHADIERSRSFGIVTRNAALVREAGKLVEADTTRHIYEPGLGRFVVSPINARKQLAAFLKGAKKELVIYDPKISDPIMIRILAERAAKGVAIKIIGRMTHKVSGVTVRKLPIRLHTRTVVRDGTLAFVGSQSLRELELDGRREVGIIFRDAKVVSRLHRVFQEDWALCEQPGEQKADEESEPTVRIAKRVAKALTKELPPVAPMVDGAVKELIGGITDGELNAEEVEEAVKGAVKEAVREAVRDVVEEVVEHHNGAGR